MAEVLIVVAIIMVLMGVGAIALFSHMRSMQQLEMDGQAKEIFVAAQNHLALADSQGYLGMSGTDKFGSVSTLAMDQTSTEPEAGGTAGETASKGVYYFVVGEGTGTHNPNDDNVLGQMLPFGSMDEAARVSGSYIIRYQKDPARILDVFYVSTTGRYSYTFQAADFQNLYKIVKDGKLSYANSAELRRNCNGDDFAGDADGAVIGYYGGVDPADGRGTALKAPVVQIVNAEQLQIIVTDYNNTTDNGGTNRVELIVTGAGGAQFVAPATVGDTKTFILDDVTGFAQHFADLSKASGAKGSFIPGENITVKAKAYNNTVFTNIAESAVQTTNSLFAEVKDGKAVISNFRHLLNLDQTVSNLGVTLSGAEQVADLNWKGEANGGFLDKTFLSQTSFDGGADNNAATNNEKPSGIKTCTLSGKTVYSKDNSYLPVVLDYSGFVYDGKDHTIRNVLVNHDKIEGTGDSVYLNPNCGLFAELKNCEVKDLQLLDFNILGRDSAGALAGSVRNSTISGILVRNSDHNSEYTRGDDDTITGVKLMIKAAGGANSEGESTPGNAGGLIGTMSGGSVTTSAAAVYVEATGDAGGLIGTLTGGSVSSSYSGGHTENAKYRKLSDAGNTILNVKSTGGNAGGLIGSAEGTTGAAVTVSASYSTCSATSAAASNRGVGGLIGKASYVTVTHSYSAGLVDAANATRHAFIGISANVTAPSGDDSAFLSGISGSEGSITLLNNVSISGKTAEEGIMKPASEPEDQNSVAYDPVLIMKFEGKYPFRTVDDLAGHTHKDGITDVHYGDWQLPNNSPLNFLVENGDTLDLKIEVPEGESLITLAVTGCDSKYSATVGEESKTYPVTRTLLLKVTAGSDKKPTGIVLQKVGAVQKDETIIWTDAKDVADTYKSMVAARFGTVSDKIIRYESLSDKNSGSNGTSVYEIHFSLDDITKATGHFTQLFCDSSVTVDSVAQKLIPGENITVRLCQGEASWNDLKTVGKFYPAEGLPDTQVISAEDQTRVDTYCTVNGITEGGAKFNFCAKTDNSLFDTATALIVKDGTTTSNYNAAIVNIRHLQNLDNSTSDVNKSGATVLTAELKNALSWSGWDTKRIYKKDTGTYTEGNFNGIYNTYLKEFNGSNFTISDLTMGNTYGDGAGSVGFFREVNTTNADGLTISNLCLEGLKFITEADYSSKGNVGAFVGTITKGKVVLDTVLAVGEEAEVVSTHSGKAAGGLVGLKSGVGVLEIKNSAASIYVQSAGAAGGLLGEQAAGSGNVSIENSYVGGHTGYTLTINGTPHNIRRAYYTGQEGESNGRWNISSTGGAAGGLIGAAGATATMKDSFSAASVSSAAAAGGLVGSASSGVSFSGTVYTVAPVSGVGVVSNESAAEGYKYRLETNGNGSVVGLAGGSFSNAFFLPDTYTNPYPITFTDSSYTNGVSNIAAVGGSYAEGTLATYLSGAKPASYNEYLGHDNNILGVSNIQYLVEETSPYDGGISEDYTFAIWTKFCFEDRDGNGELNARDEVRYYYGDWAPPPDITSVRLTVHFVSQVPEADGTPSLKTSEEKLTIMLPYSPRSIVVPYPEEILGYKFGPAWNIYLGNWSSGTDWEANHIDGGDVTEEGYVRSAYYLDTSGMGETNYPLEADVFRVLNFEENYKNEAGDENWEPGSGNPYIHLTFVSTYVEEENKIYKLRLYDYDPSLGAVSYPDPAKDRPSASLVLEASKKDDDEVNSLADLINLSLNEGKNVPARYRTGYRFLGWYDKPQTTVGGTVSGAKAIYKSTLNDATGIYTLEPVNAGDIAITKEGQEIDLYAWYEKLEMRKLVVNFQDAAGKPIEGLRAYSIPFEADRGFHKQLKLPTWGGLVPDSIEGADALSVNAYWSNAQFTGTSPTITFNIPEMPNADVIDEDDEEGEPNDTLTYNVTYRQGEATGYVVLVQLMDTSDLTNLTYAGNASVVKGYTGFSEIKGNTSLWGEVEAGGDPASKVNPGNVVSYLNTLVGTEGGFEFSDEPVIIPLENGAIPNSGTYAEYRTKIPASYYPAKLGDAPAPGAEDLRTAVGYLVVLKASRVEYELSYDSRGSDDPQPDLIAFGRPIDTFVNKYMGDKAPDYGDAYTFHHWYLTDENTPVSASDLMPAQNDTVYANRTGNPVDFRVVFWLQHADDDGYTLANYQDAHIAVKGEDGSYSGGALAGSFISLSNNLNKPGNSRNEWVNASWTDSVGPQSPVTYDLTTPAGDMGNEEKRKVCEYVTFITGNNVSREWRDISSLYHLNWEKTMANAVNNGFEVKPDGSTVVNVYYDRNIYTLWFFLGKSKPITGSGSGNVSDYVLVDGTEVKIEDNATAYYKTEEGWKTLTRYQAADGSYFYGYPATTETQNLYVKDNNGRYVPLTSAANTDTKFIPVYMYQAYTGTPEAAPAELFGIVNREYEPVEYKTLYRPVDGTGFKETTLNDGEQWGLVENAFVPLSKVPGYTHDGYGYKVDENGNYGVVGGEFTELTLAYDLGANQYAPSDADTATWGPVGSAVVELEKVSTAVLNAPGYRSTTSNSGTQYGFVNNQFVPLTAVYKINTTYGGYATGYKVNENGNNRYGYVNGEFVRIYKRNGNSGWYYYDDNWQQQPYTETRYERTRDWNYLGDTDYSGQLYYIPNGSTDFSEGVPDTWTGTVYGLHSDGFYYALSGSLTWKNGNTTYTGTRYLKTETPPADPTYNGNPGYADPTKTEGFVTGNPPAGYNGDTFEKYGDYWYTVDGGTAWALKSDHNVSYPTDKQRYIKSGAATGVYIVGDANLLYYVEDGQFKSASERPAGYSGMLYGLVGGQYVELSAAPSWKYASGSAYVNYSGTQYTRSGEASSADYDGPLYYLPTGETAFAPAPEGTDPVYGLSGEFYYPLKETSVWKYGETLYDQTRFTAETVTGSDSAYTGSTYAYRHGDNTIFGYDGSTRTYFPLAGDPGWYYDAAAPKKYMRTDLYTRAPNDTPLETEPERFTRSGSDYVPATGLGGTQYYDDPVSSEGGWVELRIITGEKVVRYDGPAYVIKQVQKADYFIHHRNFDYGLDDKGKTSTYGSRNQDIFWKLDNTTNPFVGVYTKTATREEMSGWLPDVQMLPSGYTGYFYTITARYGADIYDQWPDMVWMDGNGVGYLTYTYTETIGGGWWGGGQTETRTDDCKFVSWIRETGSNEDHLKGKYMTMSYELITNKGERAARADNNATGNVPTHILENRYNDGTPNNYIYKIHLATEPGGTTLSDYPEASITQNARSNSGTSNQTPAAIVGYTLMHRFPENKNNATNTTTIHFCYDPNGNPVTLYQGAVEMPELKVQRRDGNGNLMFNSDDEPLYDTRPNGQDYYYAQSLKFVNDVIIPQVVDGKRFSGWYDNVDGIGSPIDFTKDYLMPDGKVRLYAVYKYDPVEVTFSLTGAKFVDFVKNDAGEMVEQVLTFETAPAVTWPTPAPAKTSFTGANAVPYGDNLSATVADNRGKLLTAYKPLAEGYDFLRWEYVGEDEAEHKYYVSAGITEKLELYPVFSKSHDTKVEVDLYYRIEKPEGGSYYAEVKAETVKVNAGAKKLFTLDTSAITKPDGIEDAMWAKYTLDPPFLYATVDDDWLSSHAVNNRYKLVFSYVKDPNAWDYTVEYCVILANETESIPIMTVDKHSDTSYVFESFYSLPGNMNSGYLFDHVQLVGGSMDGTTSTDPIAIVKKNEATGIRVYLKPDVDAFLHGEYTAYYTGSAQGVDEAAFRAALPRLGDALDTSEIGDAGITEITAANLEYIPTFTYYQGSVPLGTGVKPSKVGIYRLVISVKLKLLDSGNEYLLWETPEYDPTDTQNRPGILYTIERRDVILSSKDVYTVFYSGSESNLELFDDTGKPKLDSGLPANATLADVAKYAQSESDTGVTIEITKNKDEDISSITTMITSHLSVGLSGEAYRRSPSESVDGPTDSTPNAFDFQISGLSSEELDNFNFYKSYGKIYLWNSKELYEEYAAALGE